MATYCYKCTLCGTRASFPHREARLCAVCDQLSLKRDYTAEGVGVAVVQLKREREHSKEEYAKAFLPDNSDFASPSDPEGKKGMAKWREEHAPADSNKRPIWPGEVERNTF